MTSIGDNSIEIIVDEIVKGIYNSAAGTDHRTMKRSNPQSLIDKLDSNEYGICIGLWKKMPQNFKALIDDSRYFTKIEDEDKKLVFKYILKYEGKYKKGEWLCSLPKRNKKILEDYVQGRDPEVKAKELNAVTNLRKYFTDTEMKKVGGGGGKSHSNYDYDPNDHVNQRKTLSQL
jgi:hypothetical protein